MGQYGEFGGFDHSETLEKAAQELTADEEQLLAEQPGLEEDIA